MPLGPWELAIILLIVIIIFGVGKLPQIGGALGQGIREFRTSATSNDEEKDDKDRAIAAPERERINGDPVNNDPQRNEPVVVMKDKEER